MKYPNNINKPLFSFKYDGKDFLEIFPTVKISVSCVDKLNIKEYKTIYKMPDGLEIVQILSEYTQFNACEWVLYFKNNGSVNSGIISELNDSDVDFKFEYDEPHIPGYVIKEETTKILNPIGSNLTRDEFYSKEQFILTGQTYRYAPEGGRSSQGVAPFFDINRGDKGVICAIGWTGQWQAEFTRNELDINIKTGIEDVAFRLYPNEEIRTTSILYMTYENGQNTAHNLFRRLIKNHFSIIGKLGRPENGPFSTFAWGALSTKKMVERINKIGENDLGYEYYWIDAAWYGSNDGYCPSEHVGDWSTQIGNWQVNNNYHPDGLLDVAKTIKDNNMKFLLWIEPERAISTNALPKNHPEWFFKNPEDTDEMQTWLLNLGNIDALDGAIKLVSDYIEKFDLDCYRQDFNINPLPFWRKNDKPERAGMNEIKHVMGLYKFWDTLLDHFPHLIIDNCASGGRRIDIETLKRSIPLWRSDCQCVWDCDAEIAQIYNSGISWWLPFSGAGTGCVLEDTYRFRSCYSSALTAQYWGYDDWDIQEDTLEWVGKYNHEYIKVRPFFTCDYYPIAPPSQDDSNWTAWQYDRPEQSDGIIMAFRRPKSPHVVAIFELGGLVTDCIYNFEDADTGENFDIPSYKLIKDGFKVTINKKRCSKLYFYKRK